MEKLFYCKGDKENPQGVIAALEEKGGVNRFKLHGNGTGAFYTIFDGVIIDVYNTNLNQLNKRLSKNLLLKNGIEIQPIPLTENMWRNADEVLPPLLTKENGDEPNFSIEVIVASTALKAWTTAYYDYGINEWVYTGDVVFGSGIDKWMRVILPR